MKKLIILLLIGQMSFAQIPDDKIKHFGAGVLISGLTNMIVYDQTHSRKLAFWSGLTAGILAGIGKELIDENKRNAWDNKDLLATTLGSVAVSIPLNFWERKRDKKKLF
jgi:hypothetical protein